MLHACTLFFTSYSVTVPGETIWNFFFFFFSSCDLRGTTPDGHFALPDAVLLLNAATQPAQMDGVHGGESAQEGCARPGSPLAPLRARGGDRAPPLLHCDRLRHCIGRRRRSANPSSARRCRHSFPRGAHPPDGTRAALPNHRR